MDTLAKSDLLKACKRCARRLCPSNFYVGSAACKDCVKARRVRLTDAYRIEGETDMEARHHACAVSVIHGCAESDILSGGGSGHTPKHIREARGAFARRLRERGYTINRICAIMHLSYRSTMAAIALGGTT